MLDIIVRGGTVVDGTGSPGRRADVAVQGGRIVAVEPLGHAVAEVVVDAAECVVCPGFVDMHSHADSTLPIVPTADSLVRQGITTVVVGQCGSTPVPLLPETREEVIASRRSDEMPLPWERWSTYATYLDTLREMGTSVNVVPLVGQAAVRTAVMAYSAAAPADEQLARMSHEVARAMDEGAIGVSTGLIYAPGSYATTEELIEVVRPAGERGGYYFTHIRGEADTLLDALAEAVRVGRETGAAVQISHYKASGRANWPKAEEGLDLIEAARAEGLDVSADMYPYLAGSSGLSSMLPEWALEGGRPATLRRLADPDVRALMSRDMDRVGFFRGAEWDKVMIATSPRRPEYEGHTVAGLAEAAEVTPHVWVFDALLETELQMQMISHYAIEENLERQLRRPWMMIGTDANGRAASGPLSRGLPHPRTYGTFPRVLARYVRERGVLPLEEAIRRMTALPAEKLRWDRRGLVQVDHAADLVVFDPETIADTATYEAPHQYPLGIRCVVVNGEVVVDGDAHTGARPGLVLGRSDA